MFSSSVPITLAKKKKKKKKKELGLGIIAVTKTYQCLQLRVTGLPDPHNKPLTAGRAVWLILS